VPALATVTSPAVPPAAPIITFPTNSHAPAVLDTVVTDVRGFAPPGTSVSLSVNGSLVGIVPSQAIAPTHGETHSTGRVSGVQSAVMSADGKTFAYGWTDGAGLSHTTLLDSATRNTTELVQPGAAEVQPLAFSPDGGRLAYRAGALSDPASESDALYVVD